MTNTIKKHLICLLGLMVILFVGLVFSFSITTVKAEEQTQAEQTVASKTEFTVREEAGVYIGSELSGIAFKTDVSEVYYNSLKTETNELSFYTIVTAESFLDNEDITSLTVESASEKEAIIFSAPEQPSFDEGGWTYQVAITYEDAKLSSNQLEQAYTTKLVARSFVKITEGESESIVYANSFGKPYSIREVAEANLREAIDTDAVLSEENIAKLLNYVGTTFTDSQGIVYTFSQDKTECSVTDYTGSPTDIIIHSDIVGISVTKIIREAFYNCTSLTNIEIPASVTSIGSMAFCNCISLTSVTFEENSKLTSIGSMAFDTCSLLTSIKIPAGVTSISDWAFENCTSLTSIDIPADVTSIGKYAFSNCSSLEAIEIPAGITSIGYSTFAGCKSLTNIEIPTSVTIIDSYAFSNCSSLTSIEIPDGVKSIGFEAFYNCKNLKDLIITKESDLESIGISAYEGCKLLTSVQMPNGLKNIGAYAFRNCAKLKTLDFEIASELETIGNYAFSGCKSLTNVEIPNMATSIGESAFYGCSSLTSVVIGEGVKSVGASAFYNCSSLTTLVIGKSVTSIGENAFYYCESLIEIEYESVECLDLSSDNDIFYNAGEDGEGIKVIIGKDVKGIPAYLFCPTYYSAYSPNITQVIFEEGSVCENIGKYSFYNCTSLTSIEIPNSVLNIGNEAFTGCSSLQYNVENGINYLGNSENPYHVLVSILDKSLSNQEINNKTKIIYYYAFGNCTSLESIIIPQSVISIGSYAFRNCPSLTIYCEAESKPGGWASNWNYSNCPVVWGYKG